MILKSISITFGLVRSRYPFHAPEEKPEHSTAIGFILLLQYFMDRVVSIQSILLPSIFPAN
jgi:hypothetical protein